MASEPDEVRMRDDSVSDIDGEVIGRVACASLRHEHKIPGSVVGRASLGNRASGKAGRNHREKQELSHRRASEALSAFALIYGDRRRKRLFEIASIVRDFCVNFAPLTLGVFASRSTNSRRFSTSPKRIYRIRWRRLAGHGCSRQTGSHLSDRARAAGPRV
jgi:hypothetical protein